jgi:DNA replication and repair protein RecF
MIFSTLRTYNFRNLVDSEVITDAKDIFLIGENGQGKSNFLEAIYFCSFASSFRRSQDKEVICNGKTECSVKATVKDTVENILQMNIMNSGKTILINEKITKDRKLLLSFIPSVVFCHEDLQFINGSPEQRRWFFDQNICLYDVVYLDELRKYKRILKTRNKILNEIKNGIHKNYELIDVINPQFVQSGLEIMRKRTDEINKFSEILQSFYKMVSGIDGIGVMYCPSWKEYDQSKILDVLGLNKNQEFLFGVSTSGPHRDQYIFTHKNKNFSKQASTGQRRLLSLLIRVAQSQRYFLMCNKKPVLLLDDVLLELDGEKRLKFISVLPEYDQAFYTFLPEEPYTKYRKDNTIIYRMKNGKCEL